MTNQTQTTTEILARHVATLFAPTPLWTWAEQTKSEPQVDRTPADRLLPAVEWN